MDEMSIEGDAWLERLEVEVETRVLRKKPMKNIFAALMGQGAVSGSEELNKVDSASTTWLRSTRPLSAAKKSWMKLTTFCAVRIVKACCWSALRLSARLPFCMSVIKRRAAR